MTQNTYEVLGDEGLDEGALSAILASVPQSHRILVCSGFDFESMVIAVTDQSVIICNSEGETELARLYRNISSMSGDGRTLVINTVDQETHRYRMGKAEVVRELAGIMRKQKAESRSFGETGSDENAGDTMGEMDTEENVGIGERVKFWEEQDRINQELVPRVIRQHELLTAHIADHENLPLIAGNAISEAMAEAREEQRLQHEAELAAVKSEGEAQRRQYQAGLASLQREARNMRNLMIGIASAAAVISIAAAIVAIAT